MTTEIKNISEETASRLATALERVADVLERGGVKQLTDASHAALVADIAVRGVTALREHSTRNKIKRSKHNMR